MTLDTEPPAGSVTVCLDQMEPEAAKSFPGQRLVRALPPTDGSRPAERASQEIGYGWRGKDYIFGAFIPVTGEAFTVPYARCTIGNWVDFLEQVDAWLPADADRVYAILDNLSVHRATDVLLFALAHPRWEFVFQPKSAAYLAHSPSMDDASRPGTRFGRPSPRPPPTEMPIATPSSGGAEATISPAAVPASASPQRWPRLAGCTTKQVAPDGLHVAA